MEEAGDGAYIGGPDRKAPSTTVHQEQVLSSRLWSSGISSANLEVPDSLNLKPVGTIRVVRLTPDDSNSITKHPVYKDDDYDINVPVVDTMEPSELQLFFLRKKLPLAFTGADHVGIMKKLMAPR